MKIKLGKKSAIAVVAVIIAAALVSALFYLNNQPTNGLVNVSVGIFPNSENQALIYIAQDQHYFAENGVNLTTINYATAPLAINATLNNDVDICRTSDFSFVSTSAMQGRNLTIIASIDKWQTSSVIARKDRGIENPLDLVGKRIGLTVNTANEFYFGRYLQLQGLNIADLTIVNLQPSEYVGATTNGTVDAIVGSSVYTNQIKANLGTNVVVWPVQNNQASYVLLAGRSEWVTSNPETVVKFLKSLSQAEDYFTNHRSSAQAIIDEQLDTTVTEQTWLENSISLSLGQSLISAMEDEARWLINNNLTDQTLIPDFLNYVYLEGLSSVKPEAVNVIR